MQAIRYKQILDICNGVHKSDKLENVVREVLFLNTLEKIFIKKICFQ